MHRGGWQIRSQVPMAPCGTQSFGRPPLNLLKVIHPWPDGSDQLYPTLLQMYALQSILATAGASKLSWLRDYDIP
jgi:hypothetical protein